MLEHDELLDRYSRNPDGSLSESQVDCAPPDVKKHADLVSICKGRETLINLKGRKFDVNHAKEYDSDSIPSELTLKLRDATSADASAIAAIYNHFILNTAVSFEEDPVSASAMAQRITDIQDAGFPWLLAEIDGKVAGYAYATKWRVRAAYRFAVESSVYLAPDVAGQGLGSALYARLLERLREAGIHVVIGGIALPNAASVGLHEKMGYEKVAHFSEVGRKFDRWIDVGYWQLKL